MPYETDPNGPAGQRKYGKSFTDATSPKTDGGTGTGWGPAGPPLLGGGQGGLASLAYPQSWVETANAQSPGTQAAMGQRWGGMSQGDIEKDWTGNIAPQYAPGTSATDILGGTSVMGKASDTPAMAAGPDHSGAVQRGRTRPGGNPNRARPVDPFSPNSQALTPPTPPPPGAPPPPPGIPPGVVGDPAPGTTGGSTGTTGGSAGGGGLTSLVAPTAHWNNLRAANSRAPGQWDAFKAAQTSPAYNDPTQAPRSWRDFKQAQGFFG